MAGLEGSPDILVSLLTLFLLVFLLAFSPLTLGDHESYPVR